MMNFFNWIFTALGQLVATLGQMYIVPGVSISSFLIGSFIITAVISAVIRKAGTAGSRSKAPSESREE